MKQELRKDKDSPCVVVGDGGKRVNDDFHLYLGLLVVS